MAVAPSNIEEFTSPYPENSVSSGTVDTVLTIDPNGNIWSLSYYTENGAKVGYWQNVTDLQSRSGFKGLYDWEKDHLVPWYVANADAIKAQSGSKITVGPLDGETPDKDRTLRWPKDAIGTDTDYVFFQFGKYLPPFSRDAGYNTLLDKSDANLKNPFNSATTYELYNSSANNLDVSRSANNIMLPIPQDLSNEIQQQWQGKQFTAIVRAALAAVAGGNMSYAKNVVKNITGNAKAIQTALTSFALNSIPGVGGNISFNDVS